MMNYKFPAVLAFSSLLLGGIVWMSHLFKPSEQNPPLEHSKELIQKPSTQEEWFYAMAKNRDTSYSYPTNEMVLKYNFKHGVEPLRVFIDDLNEYRFYCLNQVLLENNIEYAYYKTDQVIQLVVFLNDGNSQKKILEDFDYYQIKYSLK